MTLTAPTASGQKTRSCTRKHAIASNVTGNLAPQIIDKSKAEGKFFSLIAGRELTIQTIVDARNAIGLINEVLSQDEAFITAQGEQHLVLLDTLRIINQMQEICLGKFELAGERISEDIVQSTQDAGKNPQS